MAELLEDALVIEVDLKPGFREPAVQACHAVLGQNIAAHASVATCLRDGFQRW